MGKTNGVEGWEEGYVERSFGKGYEGQDKTKWFNFTVGIQWILTAGGLAGYRCGSEQVTKVATTTGDRAYLALPFRVNREIVRLAVESQWIRCQILRQH